MHVPLLTPLAQHVRLSDAHSNTFHTKLQSSLQFRVLMTGNFFHARAIVCTHISIRDSSGVVGEIGLHGGGKTWDAIHVQSTICHV